MKLDRDTIRRLYEQHGTGLLAYGCSILHRFTAAEDVLHEVFTKLLEGNTEFVGSPVPYLYRSVRNTCLNYQRDHSRDTDLEQWLASPPGMDDVGFILQSALRQLAEEQREVIILHIWGQLTFEEIGEALGISTNTAASRYRYGVTKLKTQFNPVPKG